MKNRSDITRMLPANITTHSDQGSSAAPPHGQTGRLSDGSPVQQVPSSHAYDRFSPSNRDQARAFISRSAQPTATSLTPPASESPTSNSTPATVHTGSNSPQSYLGFDVESVETYFGRYITNVEPEVPPPDGGEVTVSISGDNLDGFCFRVFPSGELDIMAAQVTEGFRGRGVMKNVFKGLMDLIGAKKNVKSLSLIANISVGIYAWGRYGFYPKDNQLKKQLISRVDHHLETISLTDEAYRNIARVKAGFVNNDFKENSDPKRFWDIVDLTIQVKDEEMPLGKAALLECTSWNGILHLDNEKAVDRLKTYIGYGA